jgi:hypothetical protein
LAAKGWHSAGVAVDVIAGHELAVAPIRKLRESEAP